MPYLLLSKVQSPALGLRKMAGFLEIHVGSFPLLGVPKHCTCMRLAPQGCNLVQGCIWHADMLCAVFLQGR